MYIYYKTKIESLKYCLSSLALCIDNKVVTRYGELILKDEILWRIQIPQTESFELEKLSKNEFRLSKILNLNIKNIKVYFFDRQILEKNLKMLTLISEVKYDSEELKKIFCISEFTKLTTQKNLKNNYTSGTMRIDLQKNDGLKGFLYYGILDIDDSESYIKSKVFKEYTAYENFKNIEKKDGKKYSKDRKKIEKNLNVAIKNIDYKNILINSINFEGIKLNQKFYKLTDEEYIIYNKIISNIIFKYNNLKFSEKINKTFLEIKILANATDIFKKDFKLIEKRLVESDFTINVNNIKSDLFKCIYIVLVNHANLYEFRVALENSNIKSKSVANCLLGACIGFTNSKLNHIETSFIIEDEILKSCKKEYSNFFVNRRANKNIIRMKIHFYLFKLFDMKTEFNTKVFEVEKKEDRIVILLPEEEIKYEIKYFIKKANISKQIKYFEEKTKELKKYYKQDFSENFYFYYWMNVKGKTVSNDYRMEYKLYIILKYMYNLEGRVNGN